MSIVVVTQPLPEQWLSSLASHDVRVGGDVADAEALLCLLTETVGEELLARAPRLKVVSNMAVGVDNIDIEACTARGIPVGNTPGVLTDATADLTFALLLAAARNLPTALADAAAGRWSTWSATGWLGADLAGATLGIIGLGTIGRAVCRRAQGFGMEVVFAGRRPITNPPATQVDLPSLLQQADFVSVHVPLTASTRGLIGRDTFALMKRSAILINTSRGPVVDQDALVDALRSGRIAGAALDVTVPEPLPPEHPLFSLPNAIVAPHIGSATEGTRRKMAELAAANVLAGLAGLRLPHCVNPSVYDGR